jgi:hypothetical protein
MVEFEERPRLMLLADYEGDEQRLRDWLEASGLWAELVELVERRAA